MLVLEEITKRGFGDLLRIACKVWNYPNYYRFVRHTASLGRAKRMFAKEGLMDYYNLESSKGRRIRYPQCYLVYQTIRKKKSRMVLEFGSGWTTVTIAAALKKNLEENPEGVRPIVHVMEAGQDWADNTMSILPAQLRSFCKFHVATPRVHTYNGSICTYYDSLPDVSPDVILLDGPAMSQISGKFKGLSMRTQIVADLKLLENKFPRRITILIEARLTNVEFLLRNLNGYYRCTYLPLGKMMVLQKLFTDPGSRQLRIRFANYLYNELNNKKIIKVRDKYALLP